MPEVQPDKNLRLHRQCEIRRPSLPDTLVIDGVHIRKAAGYYYDVVWIDADLARLGERLLDDQGREWVIAQVFGSKGMARSRYGFHKA